MKTVDLNRESDAVEFCRRFVPSMPYEECLESYEVYLTYREEGQSSIIARQYAGLLSAKDIGEY